MSNSQQDTSPANLQTTLTNGSFPSVAFITPAPSVSMRTGDSHLANGVGWLDSLVDSVRNSAVWSSTAIVVLWDESGGWYDHVPPPQLANTMGPVLREFKGFSRAKLLADHMAIASTATLLARADSVAHLVPCSFLARKFWRDTARWHERNKPGRILLRPQNSQGSR